ncbi:MAG: hypothetical protein ABL907_04405 [Hyphomicrobium sp.]
MTADLESLAAIERKLLELGQLERHYEDSIADLTAKIKAMRGTPEAEEMYDLRADARLALKQLAAVIADIEATYYAARRRTRR